MLAIFFLCDLHNVTFTQADMHRCAAACCENKNLSLEGVQKCVDNCSVTLNWAQSYVQREFEQCQNKLQRCVTDCNDDVRIRMSVNPTQTEVNGGNHN